MPTRDFDWNDRYAKRETPWDSGQPSRELMRVVGERPIAPCRALELGCGTGTNAAWLAREGFDVTAVDISTLAITEARCKAQATGAMVRFIEANLANLPDLGAPFPFVFDRGVYHHMRREALWPFLAVLARYSQPGGLYLTLAGNANEPDSPDGGPPRVHAAEMCGELALLFELVQLREFRFDGVEIEGRPVSPLAWSGLWRRKGG
jgi:SAM-dependent methyltransferase